MSWIVVLLGAELAAVHDRPELYRWRIRGGDIDHRSRLFIAILALSEIARRAIRGMEPLHLSELADRTNLPAELLRAELELFVRAQYLMRSQEHGEPRYAIARDLDSINVGVITEVLERSNSKHAPTEQWSKAWQFVDTHLLQRDSSIQQTTLRQLTDSIEEHEQSSVVPTDPDS